MSRVRFLQGPNLKNPYSGWDKLASNIGRTSQSVLNRIDTQEQRANTNAFRDKSFDNTVKNQDRTYDLNVDKFSESITQNNKNDAYKNTYFNYKKDRDNMDFLYKKGRDEKRDNQWENQFALKTEQANKPSYTNTITANKDGTPIISVFNSKDGSFAPTEQSPYIKPKVMTPYQEENLVLKKDAAEVKAKANQLKVIEALSAVDGWDDLNTQGQQKMIDYFNKTGLTPKINNTWFGDSTPIIPLNKEEKQAREKQLAADMKELMN